MQRSRSFGWGHSLGGGRPKELLWRLAENWTSDSRLQMRKRGIQQLYIYIKAVIILSFCETGLVETFRLYFASVLYIELISVKGKDANTVSEIRIFCINNEINVAWLYICKRFVLLYYLLFVSEQYDFDCSQDRGSNERGGNKHSGWGPGEKRKTRKQRHCQQCKHRQQKNA